MGSLKLQFFAKSFHQGLLQRLALRPGINPIDLQIEPFIGHPQVYCNLPFTVLFPGQYSADVLGVLVLILKVQVYELGVSGVLWGASQELYDSIVPVPLRSTSFISCTSWAIPSEAANSNNCWRWV
jgi:hypothetical protein